VRAHGDLKKIPLNALCLLKQRVCALQNQYFPILRRHADFLPVLLQFAASKKVGMESWIVNGG